MRDSHGTITIPHFLPSNYVRVCSVWGVNYDVDSEKACLSKLTFLGGLQRRSTIEITRRND